MKKGFTLIELLVVITILIMVSGSAIFYFFSYTQKYAFDREIFLIKDNLSALDKMIDNKTIYDYEINLSTSNIGYIYYINLFDTDTRLILDSFDFNSGVGVLKTDNTSGDLLDFDIYNDSKFLKNISLISTSLKSHTFTGELNYSIGNLNISYFSQDLDYDNSSYLELTGINTKEDKSGTSLTNVIITNLGGKKEITSGSNNYEEIYLFLEKDDVEGFIKITN